MNKIEERSAFVEKIRNSVRSGAIETASRATLTEYSTGLCAPLARSSFSGGGEYEQICELVRLHMLRTMIDAFEERSKIMQWWLLFFAVLAIVATLMPYFIPVQAGTQSTHVPTESISKKAEAPSPPQSQSKPSPTQGQRPSSDKAIKKSP